jgi:transposase-like protein
MAHRQGEGMDGIRLVYLARALDSQTFSAAITKIAEGDRWNPAMWLLRNALHLMTGVELSSYKDRTPRARSSGGIYANSAEVFIPSSKQLIFVVNGLSEAIGGVGAFEARRYVERWLQADAGGAADVLLVGGVGESDDIIALVDNFCEDLEAAVKGSMDGRKARYLKFNWQNAMSGTMENARLDRFSDEESGVRFTRATEIDDVVRGQVEVMENRTVRTLLREIAESGFVRHADLLGRRGKRQQEFNNALDLIKGGGLVQVEYILQCRKTSAQLVRVPDIEQLTAAATANFRCATCNRVFSEELASEGYGLSLAGKTLVRGSHWMTIWITEKLLAMGVDKESILWNVEDSGEEVDVVMDHLDKTWIFELKDREFGAGDAYPFNYRKVRYKAQEAVVVTTEKIAADARRVFSDVASHKEPTLIEGLSNVSPTLEEAFRVTRHQAARSALIIPSAITGMDLRNWFDAANGRN